MNEAHILIRLLWMYIPRNWEFGSALAKLRNFEGGLNPSTPSPLRYTTASFYQAVLSLISRKYDKRFSHWHQTAYRLTDTRLVTDIRPTDRHSFSHWHQTADNFSLKHLSDLTWFMLSDSVFKWSEVELQWRSWGKKFPYTLVWLFNYILFQYSYWFCFIISV
jgi:hypothetical protein